MDNSEVPNDLLHQIIWLFVLSVPIGCIAWTVTHEELFREPREYCVDRSRMCIRWYEKKFFYLFTCEYCFSHYVALLFVVLTGYKLLLGDWRGYLISFFSLVYVSNLYMSIYNRLRLDIHSERASIAIKEEVKQDVQEKREVGDNAGGPGFDGRDVINALK